ncbi:MAG TPA: IPT/TIG domain-containing protein, partial [Bryobacteraceae bacterium]|nr:IPT/TIG domain-containing protein [Bryobacteraceae bacterium]
GEHTGNIVIRSAADTVSVPVKVSVTAAPTITAVTPPALTAGSPDTRVTISGAAFAAGMSVEASGMPLQATVVDSGTLTVTIPRELLRTEGVLNLVVASVPLRSPAFAIPITAPRPTIAGAGIVNAATWVPGRVAPGQFFIIGGAGFGSESLVSSTLDRHGRFATSVAGVRVLVDEQPVPVLWLRSGVVAGQIPYGAAGKDSVRIAIEADGVTSLPVTVGVQPASPGLFTAAGTGSGQAAALNEDGAPNSASQPARRGSTIVLFAHGAGLVQPAVPEGTPVPADLVVRPQLPVEVLIGGRKAAPEYVGVAPRLISGMLQLNVRVPADAQTGANVPVVLIVGDYASPPAAIAIREETAGAAFAPLH